MATTPTANAATKTLTSPTSSTSHTGSINQPKIKTERRVTAQLIRQLSEDALKSPMAPEHVVLEFENEQTGNIERKKVYVSEINGIRTLDLYSGWDPDTQQHKLPLKTLPVRCCQLTSLERLWVSHNKLSGLPPELNQLVHLRELFLHRNSFEDIPLSLCGLPRLEILWLNCNKITSIPDEIANLKTLKRLHLDSNFLKELPDSLCRLTSLEVLYLNGNTIHKVSENLGDLKNLRRLHLQHNKITEVPISICQLAQIETLRLDDNEIRHVKRDFKIFQSEMEAKPGVIINTRNNPFFTPQSRMKLSVGSMHMAHSGLKTRRFSDQYEQESRRPVRTSQPAPLHHGWNVDSVPANLYLANQEDYKAETLPRVRARSADSRHSLSAANRTSSLDQ